MSEDKAVQALRRIADPRNTHFAGDAQVVAREALAEIDSKPATEQAGKWEGAHAEITKALETARCIAAEALENAQRAFAGHPNKYAAEKRDFDEIDAALALAQQATQPARVQLPASLPGASKQLVSDLERITEKCRVGYVMSKGTRRELVTAVEVAKACAAALGSGIVGDGNDTAI